MVDWFEPDELEMCVRCGKRMGVAIRRARTFVCFGCGYIRWSGGETTVSELQGREPTPAPPTARFLRGLARCRAGAVCTPPPILEGSDPREVGAPPHRAPPAARRRSTRWRLDCSLVRG
jgi:hypothetical protein